MFVKNSLSLRLNIGRVLIRSEVFGKKIKQLISWGRG